MFRSIPKRKALVVGLVFALALAGGCSQVFGLEPPQEQEPDATIGNGSDSDGDGYADAADNCVQFANPDQVDTDGNGVGDRCEGCVMLPLRATDDDDTDMITDTTDNCFGLSGAQADADGDGIGIGCDPRDSPTAPRRSWPAMNQPTGAPDSSRRLVASAPTARTAPDLVLR